MNAKGFRLFVAVRVPEKVKGKLREAQAELRKFLSPGSTAWTKPENMHLTLRFLGGVDSSRLPWLSRQIRGMLSGLGSVDLVCERLGCFPDLRFPRVVWVWVHDAEDRLLDLQRRINGAVQDFAEQPPEEGFIGHMTIARPKRIKRPDAERLAAIVKGSIERRFGSWTCQEVELIRSELSSQGSRYTTLDVFPL